MIVKFLITDVKFSLNLNFMDLSFQILSLGLKSELQFSSCFRIFDVSRLSVIIWNFIRNTKYFCTDFDFVWKNLLILCNINTLLLFINEFLQMSFYKWVFNFRMVINRQNWLSKISKDWFRRSRIITSILYCSFWIRFTIKLNSQSCFYFMHNRCCENDQ